LQPGAGFHLFELPARDVDIMLAMVDRGPDTEPKQSASDQAQDGEKERSDEDAALGDQSKTHGGLSGN
jgi:hypothetical protein